MTLLHLRALYIQDLFNNWTKGIQRKFLVRTRYRLFPTAPLHVREWGKHTHLETKWQPELKLMFISFLNTVIKPTHKGLQKFWEENAIMQLSCAFQMLSLAFSARQWGTPSVQTAWTVWTLFRGRHFSKFFKFPTGFNSHDNSDVSVTLLPHFRVRHWDTGNVPQLRGRAGKSQLGNTTWNCEINKRRLREPEAGVQGSSTYRH